MKYLFQSIDSRANRLLPKYSVNELKQVYTDANEGRDEKSSTHEFMDTLERIVNEIRSMTEHSQAFLQKVKKTEAPDYYNVIPRPMDLATLQKRVKSQMYRHKKTFAEDLDLIWSNCLTYNSHPSHPLRHSAQVLRNKSNQLLEFVTDPVIPARPTFTPLTNAHLNGGQSVNNSARSTPRPTPAGDDADEELDTEDEIDRTRTRAGTEDFAHSLLNGFNGRGRSASPMISQAGTPINERLTKPKLGRGPLGRRSTSTPIGAQTRAFEDSPSLLRTAESMTAFVDLEEESDRLEVSLGFGSKWTLPVASTSTLAPTELNTPVTSSAPITPITSNGIIPTLSTNSIPADSPLPSIISSKLTAHESKLISLVSVLDPIPTEPNTLIIPPPAPIKSPSELWWKSISGSVGLVSGIPHCGFPNGQIEKVDLKGKGKGKGKNEVIDKKGKGKELSREGKGISLGERMDVNLETLQKIKKLHGVDTAEESEGSDSEMEGPIPCTSYLPDSQSFKSRRTERASRESVGLISNKILGHAGFDGASEMAMGVLTHVATQYITNLGQTLKFYSDRFGSKMSAEEILLHTLSENGVPNPATLETFIKEDIDDYGQKLKELYSKLEKVKKVETNNRDDSLEPEHSAPSDPREELAMGPTESTLYPIPPPFIPLTSEAVESQIGLLIPFYHARQKTEIGLIEDSHRIGNKISRPKIPPSGKIAVKVKNSLKMKREMEENGSSKKKRKAEDG